MSAAETTVRFGHAELPPEQREALQKAKRLEWITIGYMISCVVVIAMVMGSSQTMKAAWIEDILALIPPIAFLIAARQVRKAPSPEHPYGQHRAVSSGHLAASTALLLVGGLLLQDSASALLAAEHPPVGTMQLFGGTFWAGWAMIAALVYTGVGPVILGRAKLPLAKKLHDRVLFADADMQKADWMTAAGSILGILGIGAGIWWADAGVAIAISLSILWDGWSNLRYALRGLMDGRARTYDDKHTHPLVRQVQQTLEDLPWSFEARARVRDVGHLLNVEAYVVPRSGSVTPHQVEQAAESVRALDWKLHEVTIMPVAALPEVPDPVLDQD